MNLRPNEKTQVYNTDLTS